MTNFESTYSFSCMDMKEGESRPEFMHPTSNHGPLWGFHQSDHLPLVVAIGKYGRPIEVDLEREVKRLSSPCLGIYYMPGS